MQDALRKPLGLATFLDHGCDLARFPGLDGLAEAVVVQRRLNTPEQNAAQAALLRGCVERWLGDGADELATLLGGCAVEGQAVLTAFAWAAECYQDPLLAERFERALPPDVWAEHIEWVCERRARGAA